MRRWLTIIAAIAALAGLSGAGPALAAQPTWTIQPTLHPAGSSRQTLEGVSCWSATGCIAVGATDGGPLAEIHGGSGGWVAQTVPSPSQDAILYGVSCLSATDCTAFGSYQASTTLTLAEHWDGTSWTVQPTPNPPGGGAEFYGGSCFSADDCTAVGDYPKPGATGPYLDTLAEHWDGTSWAIEHTPNPPESQSATLYGVSCASATHCTAVGDAEFPQYRLAMIAEQWNGTRWFLQTPPSTASASSELYAVSCSSTFRCMAVGSRATQNVSEYWDDRSWATQVMPAGTELPNSVSCRSAANCTAVGYGGAEYWDGTSWSYQPTPDPHGNTNWVLNAVSCPTATACTAVGDVNLRHRTNTLAEHR